MATRRSVEPRVPDLVEVLVVVIGLGFLFALVVVFALTAPGGQHWGP